MLIQAEADEQGHRILGDQPIRLIRVGEVEAVGHGAILQGDGSMSERNIEQYRRWFEAYNARDTDRLIEYCDPAIEFHSVFAVAGGAVYNGHEGMRKLHQDFRDVWGDEVRFDAEAYFDLGDSALVFGLLHGRGRQSGLEVAMAGAQVTRWRDGLMVYAKGYAHREEALTELGVSEHELEPIDP